MIPLLHDVHPCLARVLRSALPLAAVAWQLGCQGEVALDRDAAARDAARVRDALASGTEGGARDGAPVDTRAATDARTPDSIVPQPPDAAAPPPPALQIVTTPWPQPVGSYYRYAPTAVEEGGYRYTFWCANKVSGVVTDHIIVRRDQLNGSGWTVGSEQTALAPGAAGAWDARHVCDPEVLRGEFRYQAPGQSTPTTYAYALFYTGINAEQDQGGVNQVGWAVAQSLLGPWKRVSVAQPLIGASQWWGAGQPAATSVDGHGELLLFYTRGDANGTRTLRSKATLLDANNPVLAAEVRLPEDGLTLRSGAPDSTNHGGALVYDIGRDLFWLIRSGHPFPGDCPSFTADHLQVASIPGPSVWSGKGRWTVHASITDALLGSARVFDGGFAKNPYGNLLAPNRLELIASVSQACVGGNFAPALWSYRTHGVQLTY